MQLSCFFVKTTAPNFAIKIRIDKYLMLLTIPKIYIIICKSKRNKTKYSMSVESKVKNAKRVQDVKKHYRLIALSGLSFFLTFLFTMIFKFTVKPKKVENPRAKFVKESYTKAFERAKGLFVRK
jgi:hypothetical protein